EQMAPYRHLIHLFSAPGSEPGRPACQDRHVPPAPATTRAPSPARAALDQIMADPQAARRLAAAALRDARRDHDPDEWSTAERALGLAALQLRDGAEALAHLRRAVAVARRPGLTTRTGAARMSPAPA